MTKKGARKLKISKLIRWSDYKKVPQLRISGMWMEQLGFKIGDRVQITTREKLLIIEPLEVNEEQEDYKAALKEVKQTLKRIS